MTFIDSIASRTVQIVRKNTGTRDPDTGQFVSSDTTIQSGIVADLQATLKDSIVAKDEKGADIQVDFVLYPQTYLSTAFKIFDLVIDDDDQKEYDILNIRDFRDHWELFLRARGETTQ